MKSAEIKELSGKEIIEKIQTQKAELNKIKLNHAISPLENPNVIKNTKKVVARLKTELRKRELSNQVKK